VSSPGQPGQEFPAIVMVLCPQRDNPQGFRAARAHHQSLRSRRRSSWTATCVFRLSLTSLGLVTTCPARDMPEDGQKPGKSDIGRVSPLIVDRYLRNAGGKCPQR
jgi:hypothetical protein